MCNAWNHPPGCPCGWGGYGYRGGSIGLPHSSAWSSTWASYVNPSAACPVCGASVFFYQSPNGGRVFFDQLGPPWPKHPCTDTGSQPLFRAVDQNDAMAAPDWLEAGWKPLLEVSASDLTPDLMRVEARLGDVPLHLYIPKTYLRSCLDPIREFKTAPVHARPSEPDVYQVELLGPAVKPISILGFSSMADALAQAEGAVPTGKKVQILLKKRFGRH